MLCSYTFCVCVCLLFIYSRIQYNVINGNIRIGNMLIQVGENISGSLPVSETRPSEQLAAVVVRGGGGRRGGGTFTGAAVSLANVFLLL